MEIDIRKAKEDEKVESIRWGDNDSIIYHMDSVSCIVSDSDGVDNCIKMKDIDNLILALKKYKELYGWNVA